jgi:hypothetical protein
MALAGRSTTSPAAMRLTVSGGRRRMGIESGSMACSGEGKKGATVFLLPMGEGGA